MKSITKERKKELKNEAIGHRRPYKAISGNIEIESQKVHELPPELEEKINAKAYVLSIFGAILLLSTIPLLLKEFIPVNSSVEADVQRHGQTIKDVAESSNLAKVLKQPDSLSHYDHEASVSKAWEDAYEANKDIDRALDEILNDYKKKAVRHYVTAGGSGAKVDVFILESGETVYCKTSISDGGRAVDCSE
jgi:hypothetical protein